MSGFQAVQGVVVVFAIIFLALLIVMVLARKRGQRKSKMVLREVTPPPDFSPEAKTTQITSENKLASSASQSSRSQENLETVPKGKEPSSPRKISLVTNVDSASVDYSTSQEKTPSVEVKSAATASPKTLDASPAEESTPLSKALEGTRQRMWGRLQALWSGSTLADMDEIEEILYTSDLGPQTVSRLLESIKQNLSRSEKKDSEVVRAALRSEILQIFKKTQGEVEPSQLFEKFQFQKTSIWLVVGVNGAGKTTSIGKIAAQLAQSGKKVLLAAGDTFRAAAGSQLKVWTERAQVEIFSPEGVTDPSAVAFDAAQRGVAKNYDVVIIDTAGRLHTQHNLMEEIKKMKRVIQKVLPEAPHEILLVLDSNQGQNALMQAKEFHKALGVTGVVLTKLDGSAKGGVAVGVAHELELPIKLIGVGEKMEDLRSFSPQNFVESIL